MNIESVKKFFKRRNIIEKTFIGVSCIILVLGTAEAIEDSIYRSKKVAKETIETSVNEAKKDSSAEVIAPPVEPKVQLPTYTIEKIDNSNIGSCVRETLHIVVQGNYTKEQLYKIAEKEIKNYTSTKKVNALTVGFYEFKDSIGKGYEMGRVEYAPFGEFGRASEVKTGDYSNFKIVNMIQDKIVIPKEEVKVAPETSSLEKIKADFENVYSDSKVSISKDGSTLKVSIQEPDSEFNLPVDETAISVYTEEALDNVGKDIKTIDITIKRPNSSVRAKLDMSRLITTGLGSYFDIEYIMRNMY